MHSSLAPQFKTFLLMVAVACVDVNYPNGRVISSWPMQGDNDLRSNVFVCSVFIKYKLISECKYEFYFIITLYHLDSMMNNQMPIGQHNVLEWPSFG